MHGSGTRDLGRMDEVCLYLIMERDLRPHLTQPG
jgi:hypothetical protein